MRAGPAVHGQQRGDLHSRSLAGIYNSGAGSADIKDALEKLDADRNISWITHELSDDHRQYLLSGVLAMVVDQDPHMQALTVLRYLVEHAAAEGRGVATSTAASDFRVYFAENVNEGPYLSSTDPLPGRLDAVRATQGTRGRLQL